MHSSALINLNQIHKNSDFELVELNNKNIVTQSHKTVVFSLFF